MDDNPLTPEEAVELERSGRRCRLVGGLTFAAAVIAVLIARAFA